MKGIWCRCVGSTSGVLVLLLCGVLGCHAHPRVYDDPDLKNPGTFEKLFASDYWQREEVPPLVEKGYRKVAITEFSVEFVTHKVLLAGAAPASRVDWTLYTPIGLIRALFGIGRRFATYDEKLLQTLPSEMYEEFVDRLESLNFSVLPKAYVARAPASHEYRTEEMHSSSWLRYFNPVGIDTGRIGATETYPADHLRVVVGAMEGIPEEVDLRVLRQVRADVVVRAKFRVGVHKGVAALESGSVVFVTAKDVDGFLQSHRSLVSEKEVIVEDESGFMPLVGTTYVGDSKKFRDAMRTLFPAYLTLARPDPAPAETE